MEFSKDVKLAVTMEDRIAIRSSHRSSKSASNSSIGFGSEISFEQGLRTIRGQETAEKARHETYSQLD